MAPAQAAVFGIECKDGIVREANEKLVVHLQGRRLILAWRSCDRGTGLDMLPDPGKVTGVVPVDRR